MQARVRFVSVRHNPLRRSCVSSARNAGESAICLCPSQPSAEIVRVECAKCKRECDLDLSGAALCGDRACRVGEMQASVRLGFVRRNPRGDRARRVREMQARVRFVPVAGNPLRRSCVSSARNAGESAILSRATLCGDRACRVREVQARVRFYRGQPSAEIVRVECAKCR